MSGLSYNLADLFAAVAAAVPDRTALVHGKRRISFCELDERATRFAHWLASAGVEPEDRIAILSRNRCEWLEAFLGAFKVRAVPVNVNYRYVASELQQLLCDAGPRVLVVERELLDRAAPVLREVGSLRWVVVLDAEAPAPELPVAVLAYEEALRAGTAAEAPLPALSSDDRYVIYTGGTTGAPKGVVWRCEDLFFAALLGGGAYSGKPIERPEEIVSRILPAEVAPVTVVPMPLMHAGGQWAFLVAAFAGGRMVLPTSRSFDPAELLGLVSAERAMMVAVSGDALAVPLVDELRERGPVYDLSSLRAVANGAAPLSRPVREALQAVLPGVLIRDTFGSSESGSVMSSGGVEGASARFEATAGVAVLDEDLEPLAPGSEEPGWLACSGHLPLGYAGDPEKTAATFRSDARGRRWVITGDRALALRDGSLVLLGRDSATINTGGEKVFAEEVEAAILAHESVADAVVVGGPDPRFGQRVVAAVKLRPGATLTLEALQRLCREQLAGYKLPRELRVVDAVPRTPVGKIDRVAARALAQGKEGSR